MLRFVCHVAVSRVELCSPVLRPVVDRCEARDRVVGEHGVFFPLSDHIRLAVTVAARVQPLAVKEEHYEEKERDAKGVDLKRRRKRVRGGGLALVLMTEVAGLGNRA